jgi:hypothetical protein
MITFKGFLTESQGLSHWPKTLEELKEVYMKVCIHDETGEVMMPPIFQRPRPLQPDKNIEFNDDLSVTLKDDIRIEHWMLVNGMLPFKIREVDGDVAIVSDCGLASLIGLPRKCKSIIFGANSLTEAVKNLQGGPEEVEKAYIVSMCDALESLDGLPKNLPNDVTLNFFSKNLKDFSALPKRCGALTIGHSEFFNVEDLKYLPEYSNEINFSSIPKLTSFHNINKYVKSTYQLGCYKCKISSSILGLSLIKELDIIDDCFYDVNGHDLSWPTDGILPIVEKYIGKQDIFEFQEELVNAGFNELAKL